MGWGAPSGPEELFATTGCFYTMLLGTSFGRQGLFGGQGRRTDSIFKLQGTRGTCASPASAPGYAELV